MSENSTTPLYCANHPDRETSLRCNRCGKPICVQCAILTPTGYRCKECVRGQQKVFDTAQWIDFPLAFIIAAVLAYIGSLFASFLSFFTIFLAPIAGVVIAEAVRLIIHRRRSRHLFMVATAGIIVGSLPRILLLVITLVLGGLSRGGGLGAFLPLVWQGLFVFLAVPSFYYRLSGIEL
jgi:hypothetical protein